MPVKSINKMYTPGTPIDLSLFSHIENDPFLGGTFELEGNQFGRTIGYLTKYCESLGGGAPEFKLVHERMQTLLDVETRIMEISKLSSSGDPAPNKVALNQLSENIAKDVLSLRPGNYFSFPGGWVSRGGSHAMVYQFKMTEDGLEFYIHNAGAGIQNHERKSAKDRELYYPVLAYKIPAPVDDIKLAQYLSGLLRAQLPGCRSEKDKQFDANKLYKEVIPRIAFLDGKQKPVAHESKHAFTASQLSGTCAQRSLHQMLKENFKDLHEYQRFIYAFKRYALDDYIKVLKERESDNLRDPRVQNLLKHAMDTLVRTLNIPGLFEDEKIKDELWQIKEYRDLLQQNPPNLEAIPLMTVRAETALTDFHLGALPDGLRTHIDPLVATPKQTIPPERKLVGGEKLIEELEGLLADCKVLDGMGCHVDIIKRLEEVITSLPIPKRPASFFDPIPFYSGINQGNQQRFYDLFSSIQQSYRDACQKQGSEVVVPRMLVVGLSAMAVVDHIACQLPMDSSKGREITPHRFFKERMRNFFNSNQQNAYFATNVPGLDGRLKAIEDIYCEDEDFLGPDKLLLFYKSIISSEPELEAELREQYKSMRPKEDKEDRAIVAAGLQALYVFTKSIKELRADSRYGLLTTKFDIEKQRERCFYLAFKDILYDGSLPDEISLGLSGDEVTVESVLKRAALPRISRAFLEQKYTFEDAVPAKGALQVDVDNFITKYTRNSLRDNVTQLYPASMLAENRMSRPYDLTKLAAINARRIDKEEIQSREFFHLRGSSRNQILLTIDYFSRHMSQLASPSTQTYFEANLFQPGLLLKLLKKDPLTLMDKFDAWVDGGLKHFSENGFCSQESLFFIREAYLFYRYIAEFKGMEGLDRIGLDKLRQLQERLVSILDVDKDNKTAIKQTLYQYQFLTAMALYNLAPDKVTKDETLRQSVASYFFMNAHSNPGALTSTAFRFDIECVKGDFKHLVAQSNAELLQGLVGQALTDLGLGEIISISREANGLYQVLMKHGEETTPYYVDVDLGLIFDKQGLAFTPIPLVISQHKVLPFLGVEHLEPCFCSNDQRVFQLAGGELRFIRETPGGSFRVQKKWIVDGQAAWFELHDQGKSQKDAFDLGTTTLRLDGLPKALKQRDTAIWVAVEDNNKFLLTENNRPAYLGVRIEDTGDCKIQELDGEAKPTGYILCNKIDSLKSALRSFEGQEFVVVCEKGEDLRIKLGRYGLTLLAHKEVNGGTSIVIDGTTNLKLVRQMNMHIPGVAGLVFQDLTTKKQYCYMPLQPFRNTGKPLADSEFYALAPDLEAIVPTKVVQELTKKDPNDMLWEYRGKERFLKYELGSDGLPIAESPADALYLAYVYLGVHQPEKAWEVLDDCRKRLGGVKGNVLELSMLELLVGRLPFCVDDSDEEAAPNTPSYVACKLKAIALFTSGYSPDKEIKIPEQDIDANTPDGLYQTKRTSDLREFYDALNSTLANLYSRFQNMERSLTHQFRLADDEKKSLLDYYHFKLPEASDGSAKALGALGYSWRMLGMRELGQELAAINALEETQKKLPEAYQKRRAEILDIVKDEALRVSGNQTSSELESIPINLDIPAGFLSDELNSYSVFSDEVIRHLDFMDYWYRFEPLINDDKENRSAALKALNMDVTDGEIAFYLHNYYHMITGGEASKADRAVLIDFCRRYLMATYQTPLKKQSSKVAYLCNILLRINENPELIQMLLNRERERPPGFARVLKEAETIPSPVISLCQLKDTTSSVLASASSIWAEIEPEIKEPHDRMSAIPSAVLANYSSDSLIALLHPGEAFMKLVSNYRDNAHIFGRAPAGAMASGPGLEVLSKDEKDAGRVQYTALQEMTSLATQMFGDKRARDQLKSDTQAFITELDRVCEDLLQEALQLGNQGPQDPKKRRPRELEIEGNVRAPLDKAHLLALFFKADRAAYKVETGLSAQDIETLHTKLSQYVALSVRSQALHRLDTQLDKASTVADGAQCQKIAQELLTVDEVDYTNDAVLAFFQYNENLLLRPQQIEAIKRLMKAPEFDQFAFAGVVEKIIMGGGKSKVILPVLAQTKATGSNLVVIEVPRSLLETNLTDLSATSSRLFDQKAVLFEFNINSDCSPKRLEFLYSQLIDVIVHKDYLVLAGDSVQSLELKYLKLLLEKPESEEELKVWTQQVAWLDKIVGLFRTRADVVMDEVHQALLYKKKLNYTLGDKRPIPKEIIAGCVDLYKFFDEVSLEHVEGLPEGMQASTLARVITESQLLENEGQWQALINQLAHQLLNNPNSPIKSVIDDNGEQCKEELLRYFANKGTDIPLFIQRAPGQVQNILALYKEQLSQLLSQTLRRKLNENYGASRKDTDSGIAIPYVANNVPSEQSRFGNFLEAINFSIQMLMKDGLPEALLKTYLKELQSSARIELMRDASIKNIEETPTAKVFCASLAEGLHLSHLKLDDDKAFHEVFIALRYNKNMICEVLKTHVLPQIQVERKILHSDAYSHVAIYRSCQGITGTPWNSNTYHQSLTYNKQSAAATDGFILEILKQKKTKISPFTYQSPEQILENMFGSRPAPDDAPVRAIVDISATFKGIENLAVAEYLAKLFKGRQDQFSDIKFILFFNDKNLLCAMDIQKDEHAIIEIGATDPQVIDAKLGCGPAARFSYYDQAHTVGTDLKQAPTAKAMVLIDNDTPLQSFLQGTMRMRGLQDAQSVEICVPPSLNGMSIDQLVDHMVENEERQLKQEVFTAALGKMTNVIRADFMKRILALPSDKVDEKNQYALVSEAYFVDEASTDFAKVFGALTSLRPPEEIFNELRDKLIKDWSDILRGLPLEEAHIDVEKMKKILTEIIDDALPKCAQAYRAPVRKAEGTEIQLEKQMRIELQRQAQLEQERYNSTLEPLSFTQNLWLGVFRTGSFAQSKNFKTISQMCSEGEIQGVPQFGEIYVDENYSREYKGQARALGDHLKPVHALLFSTRSDGQLECLILSQEEAEEVSAYLDDKPHKGVWLTTTQHSRLEGDPPKDIQKNPNYQALIEQARFFNGELGLLRDSTEPLSWLSEDTEQKLTFFEQHLALPRAVDPSDLVLLRQAMSQRLKAFQYIAHHPLDDLSKFDWKAEVSKELSSTDIEEAQKLAKAFAYANQHAGESDFSRASLPQRFGLSLQAASFMNDYEQYVKQFVLNAKSDEQALKNIIVRFPDSEPLLREVIAVIEHPSDELLNVLFLFSNAVFTNPTLVTALLAKGDDALDKDNVLKMLARNLSEMSEEVAQFVFNINRSDGRPVIAHFLEGNSWTDLEGLDLVKLILACPHEVLDSPDFKANKAGILDKLPKPRDARVVESLLRNRKLELSLEQSTALFMGLEPEQRQSLLKDIASLREIDLSLLTFLLDYVPKSSVSELLTLPAVKQDHNLVLGLFNKIADEDEEQQKTALSNLAIDGDNLPVEILTLAYSFMLSQPKVLAQVFLNKYRWDKLPDSELIDLVHSATETKLSETRIFLENQESIMRRLYARLDDKDELLSKFVIDNFPRPELPELLALPFIKNNASMVKYILKMIKDEAVPLKQAALNELAAGDLPVDVIDVAYRFMMADRQNLEQDFLIKFRWDKLPGDRLVELVLTYTREYNLFDTEVFRDNKASIIQVLIAKTDDVEIFSTLLDEGVELSADELLGFLSGINFNITMDSMVAKDLVYERLSERFNELLIKVANIPGADARVLSKVISEAPRDDAWVDLLLSKEVFKNDDVLPLQLIEGLLPLEQLKIIDRMLPLITNDALKQTLREKQQYIDTHRLRRHPAYRPPPIVAHEPVVPPLSDVPSAPASHSVDMQEPQAPIPPVADRTKRPGVLGGILRFFKHKKPAPPLPGDTKIHGPGGPGNDKD